MRTKLRKKKEEKQVSWFFILLICHDIKCTIKKKVWLIYHKRAFCVFRLVHKTIHCILPHLPPRSRFFIIVWMTWLNENDLIKFFFSVCNTSSKMHKKVSFLLMNFMGKRIHLVSFYGSVLECVGFYAWGTASLRLCRWGYKKLGMRKWNEWNFQGQVEWQLGKAENSVGIKLRNFQLIQIK